jgi:hypothetical protein
MDKIEYWIENDGKEKIVTQLKVIKLVWTIR